jgi:ribosomal protein S18 acetylase RimI-like enzyme
MVTIRPEAPDDAEAVAGVHVRTWQAAYAGIMPDEILSWLNVGAWAQRRREVGTADPDHPFTTLLAEDGDTLVGFTTVGPYRNNQDRDDLDHRYGEILAMYVEPARWGTGVGHDLMAEALAELAARGWAEVRLWVLEENARARRFYERAGLAADGERTIYELARPRGQAPLRLAEIRYAALLDGR